jgi:hypothetical protein
MLTQTWLSECIATTPNEGRLLTMALAAWYRALRLQINLRSQPIIHNLSNSRVINVCNEGI